MSLSNGFDARASSLVGDIDAAIERVVAHFEDNDIALRVDVLRALAAQAKLSFETERMKERLHQHPITQNLIDAVTTRSTVYERLAAGLAVQEFSSEYDAQRNVEILATVQWLLKEDDTKQKKSKKRKTQGGAASSKADRSVPLILRYAYSRSLTDETTTLVEFRVTSCVGNGGKPKELVCLAMSSSAPYPRSFYEDVNEGGLSDEEDEEDGSGGKTNEQEEEEAGDGDSEDDQQDNSEQEVDDGAGEEDHEGSEAGSEQPESPFGEAVEAFAFDESAVEEILAWLGEDNVDPADVVGFFLALPVYEDEWQLDERITEIVFTGQSEDGADDLSDEEQE